MTEEVGIHWNKIAATLGIKKPRVDAIRKFENDTNRADGVFQEWCQNASGLPRHTMYPLSWNGLKEILDDSEVAEIGKQFFEILEDV